MIDIHSHLINSGGSLTVQSLDPRKINDMDDFESKSFFTFGLHPWWIKDINKDDYINLREKMIVHEKFLALGEIGLDFASEISRDLQEDVFFEHLEFAKKNNIQAIIIHCVRAFNEIIKIVKKVNYQGKLIFHDYNGNIEISKRLLQMPSYFSFGKKLFDPRSNGFRSLSSLPMERIFLETDEGREFNIIQAYEKISDLLKIEKNTIIEQINKNFNECFGRSI